MQLEPKKLPTSLEDKLIKYFGTEGSSKAVSLFKEGQVKVEYIRGELKTKGYAIVSAAVFEDREHLCHFKIKRKEEVQSLQSNCDCFYWNKDNHCHHIAAVYLKYQIQHQDYDDLSTESHKQRAQFLKEVGSRPKAYGHIVNKVSQLDQVARKAQFATAKYQLESGKIISYGLEKPFEGKLRVSLVPSYKFYFESNIDVNDIAIDKRFVTPEFSYLDKEGNIQEKISLFEHTRIFNWESGDALTFSDELRDFVRKLRYKDIEFTTDDYLHFCLPLIQTGTIELSYEGIPLIYEKAKATFPRVVIVPAKRKNHVSLSLEFLDAEESLLPVPQQLSMLCFQSGYLSSFKKKSDAYKFVNSLAKSLVSEEDKFEDYQLLRTSHEREVLKDTIENFVDPHDLYLFHEDSKILYKYDRNFVHRFIVEAHKQFGESFFRFSNFNSDENKVEFEVSTNNLLGGVSSFHSALHFLGVQFFYDRNQVARWNSRIRFERRQGVMNWFELDLKISNEDLEIVKNADLDNDFAITTKGLVLLSPEQKDLVRFMKRYTKYEKQEELKLDDGTSVFKLPFNRARIFELFELKKLGIEGALKPEEIELCERLLTLKEVPEYEMPEPMNQIARPYQKIGYNWLRFLFENQLGACLADDMGLGKTLQTITFIKSVYDQVDKILIICPVSILVNWQREFEKFSDLNVHIYYGGERTFESDSKIILTSYGVMKKEFETTLKDEVFDIMVMDEVQHLKNLRSLGALAARNIKAKFRVCLTGTPVENDLSEFYNILDLSIPGIWGDLKFVRSASNKNSRFIARKTAKPFILRRTKDQVLTDLPPKIENKIHLSFSEEEEDYYKNKLVQIKSKIDNVVPRKRYGEILKGLLELRQLCLWQSREKFQSTKVDFLLDNLEQLMAEGHQAIVFSQFTTYLDHIQREIEKRCWKYARIDGSQSFKKRSKSVDVFQSGKAPIFLISLKAGGVGLNLTAASYVFLMDPWWNPAVEAQAIDRAHRIGQKNVLNVYRPIIKDSVEEKVLKLQEIKRELFQDLMADKDDSYFTGKLTMDDFADLLT